MNHRLLGGASVALCSLALAALPACAPPAEETAPADGSGEASTAPLAETVTLVTTEFRDQIELNGETVPVRTAMVSSELAGRVTRFSLEEGEDVDAGDLVMRVSTTTLGPQREQLLTTLSQLERDIARQEQLIERGLGTEAELQRLRTEATLTSQRVDEIDTRVGTARTLAPIGGVVVDTMIEPGEFVGPGTPVARIVDIDTLHVVVGLPEHEISYVEEGMEVTVRINALDLEVPGTLTEIALEADRASRAFPLEITIDNQDRRLRAGMRATVSIPREDHPNALLIPRDAIMQGLEGEEVFVHEDGLARLRAIDVGPGRGGYTMVTSGLDVGDELVIRGQMLLVNGEEIRTVNEGDCCADQFRRYLDGASSTR